MGTRFASIVVAGVFVAGPAGAQGGGPSLGTSSVEHAGSDSVPAVHRAPLLRWQEAAAFAVLFGVTFANDQSIRNYMHDRNSSFGNALGDVGNTFGNGVIVYPALLLTAAGGKVFHSPGVFHASWRAFESTAIAGLGVVALKSLIGRRRPTLKPNDAYDFHPFTASDNSLPSGHVGVAFALAASLAMETKDHWSDAAFYSVATLTAFARMHYDKHWASDTVLGAAVGILTARLVRRHDRSLRVGPGGVAASFSF